MDTMILVRHILKDEYAPVTDKQSVTTAKKQATSNDEPAVSTIEQVRFTDEEYWAKVVDLKLRVFKDHPHHTFNKYITTNMQLMQSFLLLAQSFQPTHLFQLPVRLPMVVPVQQAWIPMGTQMQQAWVPMVTPMQQEWTLMELPAQPSSLPVQPSDQPTQPVKPVKWQRKKADCLYIDELSQEYLQSTVGRCVSVDPGQQDLLFAMCEDSTIQKKRVYRYTKCQQHVETKQKKYRNILEQVKKADKAGITEAERTLGAGSFIKPNLTLFKEYLAARAKVEAKLTVFYNKTMSWQ
ncbi:hypothetical protein GGH96_002375 [Coemansia sp. RSA 1972]|nr:hypothetical protein GGH96_002375 [Coemansia sp. RSA 1972]